MVGFVLRDYRFQTGSKLKAGPNNINADDVEPIVAKMNQAYRILKRNSSSDMPIFGMGVLYETDDHLKGTIGKCNSPWEGN